MRAFGPNRRFRAHRVTAMTYDQITEGREAAVGGIGPVAAPGPGAVSALDEALDAARRCAAYRSARAFLAATVGTFVLGVTAIFAFSAYVNPWGDFGPTGYHRLYNARLAKANYIDSLPREQLPEAIVLGSSNTMRYSPATIERELGLSAFNFGVFWGRAEDYLCIVSHLVKDLDHRPSLLIIGIDTWSLGPAGTEHPVFPGLRRRLLNTPQLVKHHPDVDAFRLYWSDFIDAFSWQQLELSWKAIRDTNCKRATYLPMAQSGNFSDDGMRVQYMDPFGEPRNIFEEVESGEFPMTRRMADFLAGPRGKELDWLAATYGFEAFNPRRVELLEELLVLCDREHIRVAFALNPTHPVFYEVLQERTSHEQNLQDLRQLLSDVKDEHPSVVGTVDTSHIDKFGGDADGFYDAFHPATRNCDPIIERIAEMVAPS